MAIRRVACAMSGGVDSAVSALLLKRHGFDVVGVHMINWDEREERNAGGEPLPTRCSRTEDQADTEWVCEKLGIQLHVVDFVADYWNRVFARLLENYKRARTVVPDIDCNEHIKFHLLHRFAMDPAGKVNADAVAMGHYARTSTRPFPDCLTTLAGEEERGEVKLFKGADPLKDQTFFLSTLRQDQLKRSVFPVGHLLKSQVRRIAAEAGLDRVAEKKESMGICAVGKRKDFETFLANYIDPVEGGGHFIVLHRSGKQETLPQRHTGVHNFTIGKRVAFPSHTDYPREHFEEGDNGQEGGLFVARMDPKEQTVYLCRSSNHPLLFSTHFVVHSPHWINGRGEAFTDELLRRQEEQEASPQRGKRPALPDALEFRCQRTFAPVLCRISRLLDDDGRLEVEPRYPIRATAPGQRCVFYSGDECLGSAEIDYVKDTLDGWR